MNKREGGGGRDSCNETDLWLVDRPVVNAAIWRHICLMHRAVEPDSTKIGMAVPHEFLCVVSWYSDPHYKTKIFIYPCRSYIHLCISTNLQIFTNHRHVERDHTSVGSFRVRSSRIIDEYELANGPRDLLKF